ncbi:MAG: recombination protein NinG [bacterium]|nr:recombination protein NinG [bacterium]
MTAHPKPKIRISLPQLKKKVQRVVNKYVRERDKDLPCISCGKMVEKKDAGHYVAQGSSGLLRFDTQNINGQCRGCNRFKYGNLIEYRIGLVERIGEDHVKLLEESRHETYRYTREELEMLLERFKSSIKDL